MLQGKHIVLGITGSIAAYKACLVIRGLIREGAEVQVVITPAGREFITPVTLSTLTHKPVICDFFNHQDGSWHSHVELGLWADAMLVAPATASTIGKMAHGVADNMLLTTYLSMKAPVFIAPAMDLDMYAHPSTQQNLQTLRAWGNLVIEPGTGFLASKLEGKGRMQEPAEIVRVLDEYFPGDSPMRGKRVLITAGPTYERLDPVRFIGNYSSGKMGFALAEECARRGASVELVSGPVSLEAHHPLIHRTDVESAEQMRQACVGKFAQADVAILCAAVADFTPTQVADTKIKREGEQLLLRLSPTCDIARCLGQMKRKGQIVVGFALETDDEEAHARDKLKRKNLDFIVLNSLQDKGAGFRVDTNKVTIIDTEGKTEFPLKAKREVAADIVDCICTLLP